MLKCDRKWILICGKQSRVINFNVCYITLCYDVNNINLVKSLCNNYACHLHARKYYISYNAYNSY